MLGDGEGLGYKDMGVWWGSLSVEREKRSKSRLEDLSSKYSPQRISTTDF